jgi:antitoxin (DNA-binding transcriptional repressor) of toxin-antitoxin stability system
VITKRGRPVAQLTPVPPDARDDWAGAMRGTGRILGDLVAPATKPGEWAAESE